MEEAEPLEVKVVAITPWRNSRVQVLLQFKTKKMINAGKS